MGRTLIVKYSYIYFFIRIKLFYTKVVSKFMKVIARKK